jgi:type VI protein secretion system component VasK
MFRTPTSVVITATLVVWAVVLMALVIDGPGPGIVSFALVAAIGSTVALWLVWAFMALDEMSKQRNAEKAKRTAPEDDTRLSLLLQMLDEDERQALKQRLRDELSTDGEAIALDDLLVEMRSRR